MGLLITRLIFSALLVSSGVASAESKSPDPESLLSRISYYSGSPIMTSDNEHECFALHRTGYYQISRVTKDGVIETLQGRSSQQQLLDFAELLENLDLTSSNGPVAIFQRTEQFVAEVRREDETGYYMWMNPDGRNPFPPSVNRLIKWLRDFDAEGAASIRSERSICPPSTRGRVSGLAR